MAKAFRGIFTGYSSSRYRIQNPRKYSFIVSNHCTIKEYIKGVYLLNQASQLYRRLVSITNNYDDTSSSNTDEFSSNHRDTIIIDTRNQLLNILLEDNLENHFDLEGNTT